MAAVGWSDSDFTSAYGACYKIMGQKHITDTERLSASLSQRILAISGLSWNPDSKNRVRDWERYACAVTGETALVQLYRKKLLITCGPARVLRKELCSLFIHWTASRAQLIPGQSGVQAIKRWEFADNLDIQDNERDVPPTDFVKLRTEWETSVENNKASKKKAGKGKKGGIDSMLDKLKMNKLLHCSDPDASPGTLESICAFAISVIGHVRR
jgi:hypothetical protein